MLHLHSAAFFFFSLLILLPLPSGVSWHLETLMEFTLRPPLPDTVPGDAAPSQLCTSVGV